MYKLNLLRKIAAAGAFALLFNLSGEDKTAPATVDKLLLERARNGEAQAQLEAGFAFFRANNPVRAAYWFQAAAKQGSAPAQYNTGRCFLAGYGVEKNAHAALEYFKLAAEQELPPAQFETARLLLSGIPAAPDAAPARMAVAPDEKAAVELLEKLLIKRYSPALLLYADYLIKNQHGKNPQKIIALLEAAITAGDNTAQMRLADFLLSRTDSFRNEKRARRLLENASATDPEAMAKLAFAVENGFGAPPEPEKAFALYQQALEKKFIPLAASRLANYYYTGSFGVKQDIAKAVELYTRAAVAGIPDAITQLGICSKNGIGMQVNKTQAFELFFQAAKMDYAPAQYELAKCFAEGEGTAADQRGAFYWFNQAAMRYDPRAMLETGKRYWQGNGTAPDAAKAAAYLEQAYANGMNEALELLHTVRQNADSSSTVKPQDIPEFGL